jgi:hypothetical protein
VSDTEKIKMQIKKVDGANKCYIFEDGEKVSFGDKQKYLEKKYGKVYGRPAKPEETDRLPDDGTPADNAEGREQGRGTGTGELGRAEGRGRKEAGKTHKKVRKTKIKKRQKTDT